MYSGVVHDLWYDVIGGKGYSGSLITYYIGRNTQDGNK